MKEQFIPYNLALKLKEKGFNNQCFGWWSWINGDSAMYYGHQCNNTKLSELSMYPNNCSAPLWQQAFDYFRIEKKLHCVIYDVFNENNKLVWDFDIIDNNSEEEEYDIPLSETYEEARLKCLTKLIEIVENGKN